VNKHPPSPNGEAVAAHATIALSGGEKMKTFIISTSLVLALTQVGLAEKDLDSANTITPACKHFMRAKTAQSETTLSMAEDEGICIGIIDGIDEAADNVCVPGKVTRGQMVLVVIKYIDERPQRMHERFSKLAYEALKAAWPCKP
jgi:hypothetical protein